jgi:hypothetical protein
VIFVFSINVSLLFLDIVNIVVGINGLILLLVKCVTIEFGVKTSLHIVFCINASIIF